MDKSDIIEGLKIFKGNDWSFNKEFMKDMLDLFHDCSKEDFIRVCKVVRRNHSFKPAYADFYREGQVLNIFKKSKTIGEVEEEEKRIKPDPVYLKKLFKKTGLNIKSYEH